MTNLDPRALSDRAAITDLIYRYCRSVDRLDVPLGHSIWHADGWADYGPEIYQGVGTGVIDFLCAQHLHVLHHSHRHVVATRDRNDPSYTVLGSL